ncbi:MAG TPA: sigma 54-interacting transcriptional regulator [Planctomycetota bacterium]|jgi:two-component system nitrogen regulation response regulator NtrX|nr:sigma-54-dependent Fis family transcriptional regulator [Planctomycetota bacterium]NMD36925.1 sigma-54-dependent Fis family transcriptional regulator [Planctomycetota bacterium]HNR98064.1 sigma 54-interacting transcriptional regulator [Planctomycetota bacterium]HNU25573.1 sigma 54-interacting transcriptional regulator [Planctomycetota bacterium]HOE28633.1 sigma 54-interacting transcriptional regulator [Planctomycetota bacterium]
MTSAARFRIVGQSRFTALLRKETARVAVGTGGVLLSGEAGAGKELCARTIHAQGPRRRGPFRMVDCGRFFPEDLAAIIFGGAERPGTALLARANRGTLYLVHPEEMVVSLQERLLSFLKSGEYTAGELGPRKRADVRLLCGTDKELELYVRGGAFLGELWERIAASVVKVAPLRERLEDIVDVIEYLDGMPVDQRFSAGVVSVLESYPWPGNYDELIEEVERLLRTGYQWIEIEHVRRDIVDYEGTPVNADPEIRRALHEIERCIQTFRISDGAPLDFAPYFWHGGPVPSSTPAAPIEEPDPDCETWEHDAAW